MSEPKTEIGRFDKLGAFNALNQRDAGAERNLKSIRRISVDVGGEKWLKVHPVTSGILHDIALVTPSRKVSEKKLSVDAGR